MCFFLLQFVFCFFLAYLFDLRVQYWSEMVKMWIDGINFFELLFMVCILFHGRRFFWPFCVNFSCIPSFPFDIIVISYGQCPKTTINNFRIITFKIIIIFIEFGWTVINRFILNSLGNRRIVLGIIVIIARWFFKWLDPNFIPMKS